MLYLTDADLETDPKPEYIPGPKPRATRKLQQKRAVKRPVTISLADVPRLPIRFEVGNRNPHPSEAPEPATVNTVSVGQWVLVPTWDENGEEIVYSMLIKSIEGKDLVGWIPNMGISLRIPAKSTFRLTVYPAKLPPRPEAFPPLTLVNP